MNDNETIQIELTPDDLNEAATIQTKRTFELPAEGWGPYVLDAIEPCVSQGKGGYQFRVRLVFLEDAEDIGSANSNISTLTWIQIPIRNPTTGYELPSGRGAEFIKRKLRYFLAAVGYEFGEYPQWDNNSKVWTHDGEIIETQDSDAIRTEYFTKVLKTAIALYNSEEERDILLSKLPVVWCQIEHQTRTWEKNGEEITRNQANVQQIRMDQPLDVE